MSIYEYWILLFLDLINSVLKSLFEEMYRVIGDQPTCSSNLWWNQDNWLCIILLFNSIWVIMNAFRLVQQGLPLALPVALRRILPTLRKELANPCRWVAELPERTSHATSVRCAAFRRYTRVCTGPTIASAVVRAVFFGLCFSRATAVDMQSSVDRIPIEHWP